MKDKIVELSMGGGGRKMDELIEFIRSHFSLQQVEGGVGIESLDDGATFPTPEGAELVLTTDGHTVDPIFFTGGNIGSLAIAGTINDVSVMGARPIAMTSALIIEEGFKMSDLSLILKTMADMCQELNVPIIAGDTKVMPKGTIDKIAIVTTGFGVIKGKAIYDSGAKPGDKVITTGPIGDHGVALLAHREGLNLQTELKSDVAPVYSLIKSVVETGKVTAMKDPTRGGLSGVLNEFASKSGVSIWISEENIPIRPAVVAVSEILGLDPYHISCEGKAIMTVKPESAEEILQLLKNHPLGKEAAIIGEVKEEKSGYVIIETSIGGHRILEKPIGEPIPRVC
ncbi:MAG: hydrogenase expression/formation protein HypE [Candidatus Kariarchaeaceae archaeon]